MADSPLNEPAQMQVVHKRRRSWWKILLVLIAVPVGLVMALLSSYQMLSVSAQAPKPATVRLPNPVPRGDGFDAGYAQPSELSLPTRNNSGWNSDPNALQSSGFDLPTRTAQDISTASVPVVETRYETVQSTDSRTGETVSRQVPVQTTTMVPVASQFPSPYTPIQPAGPLLSARSVHGPRVMQLVVELRAMGSEAIAEGKAEAQLAELQGLLDEEFTSTHQRQTAEIQAAVARLDKLKKTLDERGKNQQLIVQRRIDQLIGKTNPLDWDMSPSVTLDPNASWSQSSSSFGTTQYTSPSSPTSIDSNEDSMLYGPNLPPPTIGRSNTEWNEAPRSNLLNERELPQTPTLPAAPTPGELPRSTNPGPAVTWDNPGRSQPAPAEDSSLSRLNELYDVIESASEANFAEQLAKKQLDGSKALRDSGEMPPALFNRFQAEFESASRKKKLLDARLKAIGQTLNDEVDAAESRISAMVKKAASQVATAEEQALSEAELRRAESLRQAARSLRAQFEEAMELLGQANSSEVADPVERSQSNRDSTDVGVDAALSEPAPNAVNDEAETQERQR